jgi:diaminohydroxyphosphoribosylaminopyrimidine deaminase/5-amino-6-(5-phosphoribosylamino)uracil reductase
MHCTFHSSHPASDGRPSSARAASPEPSASDHVFMRMALELGRQGSPAPNPHVGAVVVCAGEVVGVGHHERAGEAHAEALALTRAGARARGGVLYVTLEPCNHHGRTPPCVDAILASGVRRVVIGCLDPNPHVHGGGAEALRRAGVQVDHGAWAQPAERLIADWRAQLGTTRR